ncbi:uncharacterized protein MYCFIDRAFT_195213 [Pseudocercospora fijiensis CIRAD86]|uniref:C2H2-type domain-containing protein n=1 Tax=Pseudocercospora fijiensis (strain CIRAD86) TaxID=383855 RepID=M2ZYM2_PSEFD|nr:uncharacterized protein MYCFIDRAFT_195213 [Pseudocercospora fijiensis CIRAD86]EME84049.1 hypothetical protein MYCFIDRAFT_195213 [Pseudocercospora fijiensis CIRAD86]
MPSNRIAGAVRFENTYRSNGSKYACTHRQCHSTFGTATRCFFHYRTKHDGEKEVKCPSCDKKFTSVLGLQIHLDAHDGIKIKCPVPGCPKTCSQRGDVLRHLRGVAHKIDLPIVDQKGAKTAKYYADCRSKYSEWCSQQHFHDPDLSFFESQVFPSNQSHVDVDAMSSSGVGIDRSEQIQQTTPKSIIDDFQHTIIFDHGKVVRAISQHKYREHFEEYFGKNTRRLEKLRGPLVFHGLMAMQILSWEQRRRDRPLDDGDDLLLCLLDTAKRFDLDSYHMLPIPYENHAKSVLYGCVYALYCMIQYDPKTLLYTDVCHTFEKLGDKHDVTDVQDFIEWKDVHSKDLGTITDAYRDSWKDAYLRAAARWLQNSSDNEFSFIELVRINLDKRIQQYKVGCALQEFVVEHKSPDLVRFATIFSYDNEDDTSHEFFVEQFQDLMPNASQEFRHKACSSLLLASASAWYTCWPEQSFTTLLERDVERFNEMFEHDDPPAYHGRTDDEIYRLVYGCYLMARMSPDTLTPENFAKIIESFLIPLITRGGASMSKTSQAITDLKLDTSSKYVCSVVKGVLQGWLEGNEHDGVQLLETLLKGLIEFKLECMNALKLRSKKS